MEIGTGAPLLGASEGTGWRRGRLYDYFYCAMILVGALWSIEAVVNLLDTAFALMAVPTMTATLVLSPRVMEAARVYFQRIRTGSGREPFIRANVWEQFSRRLGAITASGCPITCRRALTAKSVIGYCAVENISAPRKKPMRLLIEHPLIVTVNDRDEIIEDGALVAEGRWIRYVGPAGQAPPGPFDRVIDARRMIAIPGLISAHCHSPANFHRGLLPGRPLEIWRVYWRATLRAMRAEDFYASAMLGALEMLKTGTTTVLDHFFGNQDLPYTGAGDAIEGMRELGLRHVVALTLSDRRYEETVPLGDEAGSEIQRMTRSETRDARSWIETCEAFIAEHHDPDRLTTCCPGPSAVQRCTDELLAGAAELARSRNLPLHLHLAETRSQKVMGPKLYGTSLLQHLQAIGVLGPNLSLAHSIWIERGDIELFARSGATAVHNPASNLRLGSGLAPIPELLSSGAHVALGTDGAASNDGQNMFDAMRLATLIHNTTVADYRMWVTPLQALRMATREGARALGLSNGILAPGRLADVVLLRRDTSAFTPLNDVVQQIALCENGSSVETVLVDGEVVVQGGRLTQRREEEVLDLTRKSMERLRPAFRKEMSAEQGAEPALAEMYFRIAGQAAENKRTDG